MELRKQRDKVELYQLQCYPVSVYKTTKEAVILCRKNNNNSINNNYYMCIYL